MNRFGNFWTVFAMTIKLKLFLTCIVAGTLMGGVGFFVYSTLSGLKEGFSGVADQASVGEANALEASQELLKADQNLKLSSESMEQLMAKVDKSNLEVKVLQRKIRSIHSSLADIASDIEESSYGMPEGDALYAIEDAIDNIADVEETIKREAFVYLDQTVGNLTQFSSTIKTEVGNVSEASLEISRVLEISEESAEANLAIKDKANIFYQEIGDLRDLLIKAFGAVAFVIIAGLALLTRSILVPLGEAYQLACRIANGEFDIDVKKSRRDEIGKLFEPLSELLNRMQSEMEESERRANESTRIRRALDNAASSVMMTDLGNEIVYLNHSAEAMFAQLAEDSQFALSGFDHNNLVGQKLQNVFHTVANESALQPQVEEGEDSRFKIGSRIFDVIPAPVLNAEGQRIGTALEWKDRTIEIGIQHEFEEIVSAAQNGDLTQRIPVKEFGCDTRNEFFASLGNSINEFIDKVSGLFDELSSVTAAMADGDLTKTMQEDYQGSFLTMKNNVNSSVTNLKVIVESVRDASDELNRTASDITRGNESLSVRTEQQSVSLVETAQTPEELTSGIDSNTDSAKQANELAVKVRNRATTDSEVVLNATKAMESINEASGKIGEIIGVINEIAFQTNLLAINASVEAARAGEQGRGFAVVASEVRNLAERSAESASEISVLIQDSIEKVGLGTELVNASGETMNELMEAVKQLGGLVDSITHATIEQASGTGQIGEIVDQMETITQENAELAEKTADDAKAMYSKTDYLSQLIAKFKVA